jgi:hypothetical protein
VAKLPLIIDNLAMEKETKVLLGEIVRVMGKTI